MYYHLKLEDSLQKQLSGATYMQILATLLLMERMNRRQDMYLLQKALYDRQPEVPDGIHISYWYVDVLGYIPRFSRFENGNIIQHTIPATTSYRVTGIGRKDGF